MLTFLFFNKVSCKFIATNPEIFNEIDQVGANGFWGFAAGVAGLVNPPPWVLVASHWYSITSVDAASVVLILNKCW